MAAKYVWINNQMMEAENAKIGVTDLALHRGYGIFDFLKMVDGRPIFIEDHFNRFFNSAEAMYLEVAYSRDELRQAVMQLTEANGVSTAGVKLLLTGGYSDDGYKMGAPNLIILQYPLNLQEENKLDKGLRLAAYNHVRQLPHIKTIDYLQAVRLHPFMRETNTDDVLYHENGVVSECPRANFYMVTDNEIVTASRNILKGITRSKVQNFNIDGYNIVERDFTLDELATAKEAFITSTTQYAFPVTNIDDMPVGDGKTGPVTRKIREMLFDLTYNR